VRALFADPLLKPFESYRALCGRVALQGDALMAA
jgi:hypothetical protein